MKTLPLLLALSLLACQNETGQPLRIATYNIRYDSPADPILWTVRKEKVANLLRRQAPDIFGVQEAMAHQSADLQALLPTYARYGVGRDDGKAAGEQTTIFYQKEKFELLRSGTFWLSETPEVPGSRNWDAAITRICSWGAFQVKKSGEQFFVFNTHFDHRGEVARVESMQLIREKIAELAGAAPFVLLGDFNFEPEEAPYRVVQDWAVQDVFLAAEKTTSNGPCTWTGFAVEGAECNRIDYIFASENWSVKSCAILDENDGTYFPSDHLPVVAELVLK